MTEDVRLGVFVHRDGVISTTGKPSHQKIIFVSDENTQEQLNEFERCSQSIF